MKKVYPRRFWSNRILWTLPIAILLLVAVIWVYVKAWKNSTLPQYEEVHYSTPNFTPNIKNRVRGVVLHHTANWHVDSAVRKLITKGTNVSSHCVIDLSGKRYVLCPPETVAWHAGKSVMGMQKACNYFTIGVEFVGNTCEKPLTEDQIKSGIEYLLPLIEKYHIPTKNIVTHKMVRDAYIKAFPKDTLVRTKMDITEAEYHRFMERLEDALSE